MPIQTRDLNELVKGLGNRTLLPAHTPELTDMMQPAGQSISAITNRPAPSFQELAKLGSAIGGALKLNLIDRAIKEPIKAMGRVGDAMLGKNQYKSDEDAIRDIMESVTAISAPQIFGSRVNPVKFGSFGSGKNSDYKYRGVHSAPSKEVGTTLDDISSIFPDDIYSSKGAQYYGHYGQNHPDDLKSINVLKSARDNPNKKVTVYRAVPHEPRPQELIDKFERHKKYILKHGKLPSDADTSLGRSEYYDFISDEIDRLKNTPNNKTSEITEINPGDWVTINRNYAVEHGQRQLDGKYKILKRTVRAGDISTDGNSIHEWGYNPD